MYHSLACFFFFQAEDGIRDADVTGVQTCALPICPDAGKAFVIDSNREGRILVGQSPACGVRLADPTVSRRHAALELAGGALRITDLGSRNGTWVNGLR